MKKYIAQKAMRFDKSYQKGEEIPGGRYIQSVFICIQNEKEEYLVQKRSKEKKSVKI